MKHLLTKGRPKNYLAFCQQNVRSLWDFCGKFMPSYFCTIPGFILCLVVFSGCNRGNPDQLPVEMVWDRVVCEQCRMALSDNRYAVQAIHPNGKPYFYPVNTTTGHNLVWLRPEDHPWHYGLWFSWKYGNRRNIFGNGRNIQR